MTKDEQLRRERIEKVLWEDAQRKGKTITQDEINERCKKIQELTDKQNRLG